MDADTQIGGPDVRFPETSASAIRDAAGGEQRAREIARERLASAYWKPVYKYIRVKWRASNEDAKDLTQAFFTSALDRDVFAAYDPEKAALRTFLRLCVDRFVSNQRAKRKIETVELADGLATEPFDPEKYFHREWVRQVFTISIEALRSDYRERGRHTALKAFELHDLAEDAPPSYGEIAAMLEVPVTQVTNFLAAARRDLRRIVLGQLRQLTATEREFRAEARSLLGRFA